MSATIYIPATFAVEGGPAWTPPRSLDQRVLTDETAMSVALVYDHHGHAWTIVDAFGQVLAEATNPGDLSEWLTDYADALGAAHNRGELM